MLLFIVILSVFFSTSHYLVIAEMVEQVPILIFFLSSALNSDGGHAVTFGSCGGMSLSALDNIVTVSYC